MVETTAGLMGCPSCAAVAELGVGPVTCVVDVTRRPVRIRLRTAALCSRTYPAQQAV